MKYVKVVLLANALTIICVGPIVVHMVARNVNYAIKYTSKKLTPIKVLL